jgi:hypothetical protein
MEIEAQDVATQLNAMSPEARRNWLDELNFMTCFCPSCCMDMRDGLFICPCDNDE